MSLEERIRRLEQHVTELKRRESINYMVELIASNEHEHLEDSIAKWLRKTKPRRIIHSNFVADGAEYTYCVMFIYEPRERPLPRTKR